MGDFMSKRFNIVYVYLIYQNITLLSFKMWTNDIILCLYAQSVIM